MFQPDKKPEANVSPDKVDRRQFLRQTAGGVLAASALSLPARSYARVVGSNDLWSAKIR